MSFYRHIYIALAMLCISLGFAACSGGTMGQEKEDNSIPVYKITYEENGATGGIVPEDTNEYTEGDWVPIKWNPGNLIKADYTFKGWSAVIDGVETFYNYENNDLYMPASDLVLTAVWEIHKAGDVDTSFDPGTGAYGNINYNDGNINKLAVLDDGKILIAGLFNVYNEIPRFCIARVNSDGRLDTNFDPEYGANDEIHSFIIQSDGKIIIVGNFTSYNRQPRNYIARLNSDGSLDYTFNQGTGADNWITSVAQQNDGKIIITGIFKNYNGTSRIGIARLNADGTLDATFNPGNGTLGIEALAVQADGKIVITGLFSSYNGTSINDIARLNTNGSLDTTFNSGSGFVGYGRSVVVQSNGKILVGGDFYEYNNTDICGVARLNSDGSIDTSFDPGTGFNGSNIYYLQILSDMKIIIVGLVFNNGTHTNVARLNPDGSVDTTFIMASGAFCGFDGSVKTIDFQSDGKIIAGGDFTRYNMINRKNILRIWNE